jgi:hypothetical protein
MKTFICLPSILCFAASDIDFFKKKKLHEGRNFKIRRLSGMFEKGKYYLIY